MPLFKYQIDTSGVQEHRLEICKHFWYRYSLTGFICNYGWQWVESNQTVSEWYSDLGPIGFRLRCSNSCSSVSLSLIFDSLEFLDIQIHLWICSLIPLEVGIQLYLWMFNIHIQILFKYHTWCMKFKLQTHQYPPSNPET